MGQRFRALDGWRGILAVAVVMAHLSTTWSMSTYLAVDVFFILSGFVITHRYGDDLWQRKLSLLGFFGKRARRLMPLHLGVLLAVLAVAGIFEVLAIRTALSGDPAISGTLCAPLQIAWDAALLSNIVPPPCGMNSWGVNGPSWSISLELWVGAAFALLFLAPPRWRIGIAIAIALACYVHVGMSFGHMHGVKDNTLGILNVGMLRAAGGFCLGYMAYVAASKLKDSVTVSEATVAEAVIVAALAACFVQPWEQPSDLAIPAIGFLLAVIFAIEKGAISRVLHVPPIQALGAYSFAIYLIHQPLYRLFDALALPADRFLVAALVCLTGIALVRDRFSTARPA